MQIRDVRMRNRDRTLYVFEFESNEDADYFFKTLHILKENCKDDEEIYNNFQELINTLQSRCDDKYAREGVVKSSSLFQDEMIYWFICWFRVAMTIFNHLGNISDELIKVTKEHTETLKECIELRKQIQKLEG